MYIVHIDFRKRLARVQDALKQDGIDVLAGTRLKTITHVCGAFCPWRSAVVVPAEGEIQLVPPTLDATRLLQESWLDNVVGYSHVTMMETVIRRILELGLEKGTIGFETGSSSYLAEGYLSVSEHQDLVQAFPEANIVDATHIIERLTMVKEEAEVQLMRQATAICDYAQEEVRKALKVGMSEKQVAGIAEKAARDAGSEFAWTFTGGQEIGSGYRSWTGACTPATDKLLQWGEFVVLDLHAMYGLMLGDVSHNAIMGTPTEEQKQVIKAYTETCHYLVQQMQPGKTLGQVSKATRKFVVENGWSKIIRGFGHGSGHLGHEWYPTLTDYEIPHVSEPDYVLEPNYMQIVALTANQPGVGGLRLERPLVITEDGNELLSKMPFEPWIIERQ